MSKIQAGLQFELEQSRLIHAKHIPILISPLVLRSYNCGQIDIAAYSHRKVSLYECKASGCLSVGQKLRIKRSAAFISELLQCNVDTRLLKKNKI